MAVKRSLDVTASQEVVEQMILALGLRRTVEVLGVAAARFSAFRAGRGRLGELQLQRVAALTRRTWQLWALDGVERRAQTERQRDIVKANRVMRELYEKLAPGEVADAEQALGLIPEADDVRPRRPAAHRRRPVPAA